MPRHIAHIFNLLKQQLIQAIFYIKALESAKQQQEMACSQMTNGSLKKMKIKTKTKTNRYPGKWQLIIIIIIRIKINLGLFLMKWQSLLKYYKHNLSLILYGNFV